jgi:hypothetical protein
MRSFLPVNWKPILPCPRLATLILAALTALLSALTGLLGGLPSSRISGRGYQARAVWERLPR